MRNGIILLLIIFLQQTNAPLISDKIMITANIMISEEDIVKSVQKIECTITEITENHSIPSAQYKALILQYQDHQFIITNSQNFTSAYAHHSQSRIGCSLLGRIFDKELSVFIPNEKIKLEYNSNVFELNTKINLYVGYNIQNNQRVLAHVESADQEQAQFIEEAAQKSTTAQIKQLIPRWIVKLTNTSMQLSHIQQNEISNHAPLHQDKPIFSLGYIQLESDLQGIIGKWTPNGYHAYHIATILQIALKNLPNQQSLIPMQENDAQLLSDICNLSNARNFYNQNNKTKMINALQSVCNSSTSSSPSNNSLILSTICDTLPPPYLKHSQPSAYQENSNNYCLQGAFIPNSNKQHTYTVTTCTISSIIEQNKLKQKQKQQHIPPRPINMLMIQNRSNNTKSTSCIQQYPVIMIEVIDALNPNTRPKQKNTFYKLRIQHGKAAAEAAAKESQISKEESEI